MGLSHKHDTMRRCLVIAVAVLGLLALAKAEATKAAYLEDPDRDEPEYYHRYNPREEYDHYPRRGYGSPERDAPNSGSNDYYNQEQRPYSGDSEFYPGPYEYERNHGYQSSHNHTATYTPRSYYGHDRNVDMWDVLIRRNKSNCAYSPRHGYDCHGYNQNGYDKYGYGRDGRHRDGYGDDGYDVYGYDKQGYDENGYDRYGYNKDRYNRMGYHYEDKQHKDGYSEDYHKDGYGDDGLDKYGYNRDGYDSKGYDRDGYDKYGYNRDGYDRSGYDHAGLNAAGVFRFAEKTSKAVTSKKPAQ